jgi:cytochrome c peroxidase
MNKLYVIFTIAVLIVFFQFGFQKPAPHRYTPVALGAQLFQEKILSLDSSLSCASCHNPNHAFADTVAFSKGIAGRKAKRNTPTVLNVKFRPYFFWDGRVNTLAEQALFPIQNPDEMGLPIDEAVRRLNASPYYVHYFKKVFKQLPDAKNLGVAFEAFQKTLETTDSKFDDWSYGKTKLSESEERGRELFVGEKARCFNCHFLEDFTNDDFKNIGLFDGKTLTDSGRYLITKDLQDLGKFKTPGLRNVAVTEPYMHNGMFQTLEEVIEYYNDPRKVVANPINIDTSLQTPLGLTEREKADLVAFLRTLTDKKHDRKTSKR